MTREHLATCATSTACAIWCSGHDVLFNLAGQTSHLDSMHDPNTDLEINCRSQLSILEACRHANPAIKVVFASTRQIYGRPQYLPVDERHPLHPVDVNGINKTAGEWYHLLYGEVYGIPVTVLRLTNTYGPRMRVKDARQTFLGYLAPRWLLAARRSAGLGDGLQRRDFNYVDDVVRARSCSRPCSDRGRSARSTTSATTRSRQPEGARGAARRGSTAAASRTGSCPSPRTARRSTSATTTRDFARSAATSAGSRGSRSREGLERSLAFYREHRDRYWAAT